MKRTDEILLALLRRALWGESLPKNGTAQMAEQVGHDGDKKQGNREHTTEQDGHDQCQEGWHDVDKQQWQEIYRQASYQGVLGVLWDGVKDLPMDKGLRLNWALNVEKIEQRYERQRIVLEELAELFATNGMDMMVIKGYGLSLLYPEPKHRPCGDIDFYLYGEYAKGDKVLEETHNLTTDLNKHHHTVNYYRGVMLENHYDFLNTESHLSNKTIEQRLIAEVEANKGEARGLSNGAKFYIPCPEFNALFLLRHAAAHFAAERIGLRHLVDWALFLQNYGERVDWKRFYAFAREMNMHRFLNAINTIAIEQLGVNDSLLPQYERDAKLEKRVLEEILCPAFQVPMPGKRNPLTYLWKLRRWTGNMWKNRIVYKESLINQFFVLWKSHILKPKLK